MTLTVKWYDSGREPKEKPNPAFPLGIDVDMSKGAPKTCQTAVPYPAPRCGYHLVKCPVCGLSVVITTAGRPDDPRSVKLACKPS